MAVGSVFAVKSFELYIERRRGVLEEEEEEVISQTEAHKQARS